MKKLNKLITVILCCVTIIFGSVVFANAEPVANAAVSVSSSSVKVGSSFTVTVKFTSTTGMGSVDAIFNYDPDVITFESGNEASGSNGKGKLATFSNASEGSKSFTFTLNFTAKATGTSQITLSDIDVSDANFSGMETIQSNATVQVIADTPLSSNNYLSSIKLSTGELSPKFSKNTTSYTVNVPNETDTLSITATCEDSKAKTSISGDRNLKVGTTTRKITVTAENGSKKVYTIKITRAAAEGQDPPSSEEPPVESEPSSINVIVDGNEYTVFENFSSVEIPDGFSETVCTVNGVDVMAVTNPTGTVIMVYLEDAEQNGAFFVYDSASITYIPYRTLTVAGNTYVELIKPDAVALPDGFVAAELAIGDQVYTAWANENDNSFYVLYLCNISGTPALYMYDTEEGTVMRYLNLSSTIVSGDDSTHADADADLPTPEQSKLWMYVCIGLAAVIIALIIVVIILAVKCAKGKKPEIDASELEFDDADFAAVEQSYAAATVEAAFASKAEPAPVVIPPEDFSTDAPPVTEATPAEVDSEIGQSEISDDDFTI